MRTIKFRAWDNVNKTMKPSMSIEHDFRDGVFVLQCITDTMYTMLQFTSLLDKNGKEIYEGDIFGAIPQLRCVVERMDDGAYKLVFSDKEIDSISILDHKISKSEIIGNIYENPSLLKD